MAASSGGGCAASLHVSEAHDQLLPCWCCCPQELGCELWPRGSFAGGCNLHVACPCNAGLLTGVIIDIVVCILAFLAFSILRLLPWTQSEHRLFPLFLHPASWLAAQQVDAAHTSSGSIIFS